LVLVHGPLLASRRSARSTTSGGGQHWREQGAGSELRSTDTIYQPRRPCYIRQRRPPALPSRCGAGHLRRGQALAAAHATSRRREAARQDRRAGGGAGTGGAAGPAGPAARAAAELAARADAGRGGRRGRSPPAPPPAQIQFSFFIFFFFAYKFFFKNIS